MVRKGSPEKKRFTPEWKISITSISKSEAIVFCWKMGHKAQLPIYQFVYNSAHKVLDTNVRNVVPPGPSLRDKMRHLWTELKIELLLLTVARCSRHIHLGKGPGVGPVHTRGITCPGWGCHCLQPCNTFYSGLGLGVSRVSADTQLEGALYSFEATSTITVISSETVRDFYTSVSLKNRQVYPVKYTQLNTSYTRNKGEVGLLQNKAS